MPTLRRRLTILLHWSVLALLMLILGYGPTPVLAWAFGAAGLVMVALALVAGLMSGPGPKLEGGLRAAHPWAHRALYALLALTCLLTLWTQLAGQQVPDLSRLYVGLLGIGMLHGIFNLWRHTALGDGVLRRMTPRALHGML